MLPYALVFGGALLAWLSIRHVNGQRTPILIGLLALGLTVGGFVELRWNQTQDRYSAATRQLLDRDDTEVICERLTYALFNVWHRAGYVQYTETGEKPRRADLTYDTCKNLKAWEKNGRRGTQRDEVIAVHVLTHETMHLNGHYAEAEAECFAMQADSRMAQLLGATKPDADALAAYYATHVYPHMRDGYITSRCQPNGPLDLTPGDGLWP